MMPLDHPRQARVPAAAAGASVALALGSGVAPAPRASAAPASGVVATPVPVPGPVPVVAQTPPTRVMPTRLLPSSAGTAAGGVAEVDAAAAKEAREAFFEARASAYKRGRTAALDEYGTERSKRLPAPWDER